MNHMPKLDRRSFLVGSATAGLSLGFHVPFTMSASAQGAPEVNAWVVIKPDDTVVVRIARSEMGQGTLTGLAQMVAEELNATGRRSRPNTRHRVRASRARIRGAISAPAAAAGFVPRTTTYARAARRHA